MKLFLLTLIITVCSPLGYAQRLETERISGRETAAREVLVRLRPGVSVQQLSQAFDAESAQAVGNSGIIRLRSRSITAPVLVEGVSQSQLAAWAEPNYIIRVSDTLPNDTSFGQLWGLRNSGQNVNGQTGVPFADINAVKAWDITTGSAQILVGVVDTGVDYTHPDLVANMWSAPAPYQIKLGSTTINCPAGSHGFNALAMSCDPRDDYFHGTHVAGTIGASGNNLAGVTGVNWKTSIVAFKFLNSSGQGSIADAINAIEAAVQMKAQGINLQVLNASWGGIGYSAPLLQAINDAHDMLFVAAAGNFTMDNDGATPYYPATYAAANIVSVAATDNQDRIGTFSNYGRTTVHLGAPGVDVYSTFPGGTYSLLSGTSMATPHVAGTAALLLSKCSLSAEELKAAILSGVDAAPALVNKTITGGRLNAYKALAYCGASDHPGFTLSASPVSISTPIGGSVSTQISVTTQSGFAGEVTFSVTGLPADVAATFAPATVTGSGDTTLTLSTSAATHGGTYPISVHGVSGSLEYSQGLSLTVNAPDFTLSASPATVTVPVGTTSTSTISVNALFGYTGVVNLTASGMPDGVTASFAPSSITNSGSSSLTLAAGSNTVPGTYLLTVQGVSGSLTHTASVLLKITTPDFLLATSPTSLIIATGNSAISTVTVAPLNGFTGIVNLTASGAPAGVTASFSSSSVTGGGISTLTLGTSLSAQSGSYVITVQGASGSLTHTATINVLLVTPLLITTTSLPNGQVGVPYFYTLAATGGAAPYRWMVSTGRLPRGLSLNESTGVISGTPSALSSEVYTFSVTDSALPTYQTATTNLVFTVGNGSVAISTASLPSGQVGTFYSQTLAASGGSAPYSWSIVGGSLPAGLTLNGATGLISGTPTTPTTASITFLATDSGSPKKTATKLLSLTIAGGPLSIGTVSLPNGQVGAFYSQTLSATGGTGSYTWSLIGGALPNGITLNSVTGQLSGTPTTTANSTLTIQVSDSGLPAQAATKVLTLTVAQTGLSIQTSALANGQVGSAYSQTLSATGGVGSYTWALVGGVLPNGLTLNPTTGQISGTPTASASVSLTLRVTDSSTPVQFTTKTFMLTIAPVGLAITTASLANGQPNVLYSQSLTATGGAAPYTWKILSGRLPRGLTLYETGVLTGTPIDVSVTPLTVQVTDSTKPAAKTATANLVLSITAGGALAITTSSLSIGQVGSTYSENLTANGGTGNYTWTLIFGTLPNGLTLNSATGHIGGSPTAISSTSLTFQVADTSSPPQTATKTLILTVTATAPPLVITTTSLPNGQVGVPYSQTLTATGGTGSYTWRVLSGRLPNGLAFDPYTGKISGTPTVSTTAFSVSFQVSDSATPVAQIASVNLLLTVRLTP